MLDFGRVVRAGLVRRGARARDEMLVADLAQEDLELLMELLVEILQQSLHYL